MSKFISFMILMFLSVPALASNKIGMQALFSSPESMLFIALIIGFICYFLFFQFNQFTVAHGPEILTTMGILGCFLGISKALLYFNSSDLTNSIPLLLEGIKTAFCVSLCGVLGALLIKIRQLFSRKPIPQSEVGNKAATVDDLVHSISLLHKGLVGDEDGTLLSQVKLMRQDSNDQLQKMCNSFDMFSKQMVENNQKAIIEALSQVISDFNNNLTEQFGDNFKELNQGVEKLVTWQKQYQEELEKIKNAQIQTASDMAKSSDAFSLLVNNSEKFSFIAETLGSTLEAVSNQKDILYSQEKALSELLIQMKDITPEFSSKLSVMLDSLSSGINEVQSVTVDLISNFGAQAQSAHAEMKNLLSDVLIKSQQQLSNDLQDNAKIIKEGVLTLDKALQKELNDSLSSLGRQLASLSEKFVNDYSPLTKRLREIVQISSNIEAES